MSNINFANDHPKLPPLPNRGKTEGDGTRKRGKARDLESCRKLIDSAKRYRDGQELDAIWRRATDFYAGDHYEDEARADRAVVNIIWSTVNIMTVTTAGRAPRFSLAARRPEDVEKAMVAEAVVNYWWRRYNLQENFQSAAKDSIMFGGGWLKAWWEFEQEEREPTPDELRSLEEEAMRLAAEDPFNADQLPTPEEIMNRKFFDVVEDRPHVDRISIHDVFVDPTASSMNDITWIAQRFARPLDEVKADKRYRPSVRRALEPDNVADDNPGTQPDDREKPEDEMVTLWEFWDVRKGEMCVFANQGDGFLVAPQRTPYPFAHPFVFIPGWQVPDHFYPLGEIEQLISLQQELNRNRTQKMNHRDRYNRKMLVREGEVDQAVVDVITSPVDNEVAFITSDRPLEDLVLPLVFPGLPPEFYQDTEEIRSDMDTVSGVSEYQRGGGGEIRRSATEASIIADSANARVSHRLAIVEHAAALVGEKVLKLAQTFMTGEQVARLVSPRSLDQETMTFGGSPADQDTQDWESFTADDIVGDFDFEVEAGSTQPKNEQQRKQQGVEMLNTLAPWVDRGFVHPHKPLEYVLTNNFGVREVGDWLTLPPSAAPASPEGAPPPEGSPMDRVPGREPVTEASTPEDTGVPGVPDKTEAQLRGQVGLNLVRP